MANTDTSMSAVHQRGVDHQQRGEVAEAITCFQRCVALFAEQRSADADSVEVFVKAAGGLCLAIHSQGDYDRCFTTAREVLDMYPVIPVAYGAMSMSIIDRIQKQREEDAAFDATPRASTSSKGTGRSRHPSQLPTTAVYRRFVGTMAGVQCSVEEAHTLMCRAVLLSDGELQVPLGPYVELAVRYVTEQLLTAGPNFERSHGSEILDSVCPLVTHLPQPAPVFLSTMPLAPVKPSIRLMDAHSGAAVAATPEEAAAMHEAAINAVSQAQNDSDPTAAPPPAALPVDFALSGKPTQVRVSRSECGGMPRSVTLVRSTAPFAVANWLPQKHADGATGNGSRFIDPAAADMDVVIAAMHSAEAMPLQETCCVACGRDVRRAYAYSTGCTACGGVTYCAVTCQEAYRERHEVHECTLRQALTQMASAEAGRGKKAGAKAPRSGPHCSPSDSEVTVAAATIKEGAISAGSTWKLDDIYARVLPLCIAVYSGIKTRAAGWECVVSQLEKGVDRAVLSDTPPTLLQAFETLGSRMTELDVLIPSLSNTHFMRDLFFMVRLLGCNFVEQGSSQFFAERLLFRHSCEPNCVWSEVLRAAVTSRFIYNGEELTMAIDSTFPQHWPWQIRSKWILREHGFVCKCARCTRESGDLNNTRGDLSNDAIEKLLTGDLLRRSGGDANGEAAALLHGHPTHYFHPRVQTAIRDALALPNLSASGAAGEPLVALEKEVAGHLLPTHYLLQDLRHAQTQMALMQGRTEAATQRGKAELFFFEAYWAGAIPAKTCVLRALPAVFDGTQRRTVKRQMRRRKGAAGSAPRQPPVPVRDYSQGSVVDQYYGSYEAWYQ